MQVRALLLVGLWQIEVSSTVSARASECAAAPISDSAIIHEFDFQQDGRPEFTFLIQVQPLQTQTAVSFRIDGGEDGEFLESTPGHPVFGPAERISAANPIHRVGPGLKILGVDAYQWEKLLGDNRYAYYEIPKSDIAPGETAALSGFRFVAEDGDHFGWLRLTRPCTTTGVPYVLSNHAFNTNPGDAVNAGVPPPGPRLSFAVVDGRLVLGWPYLATDYRLESATSATEPITWEPVHDATGNNISLPLDVDGEDRYFRLTKLPP